MMNNCWDIIAERKVCEYLQDIKKANSTSEVDHVNDIAQAFLLGLAMSAGQDDEVLPDELRAWFSAIDTTTHEKKQGLNSGSSSNG